MCPQDSMIISVNVGMPREVVHEGRTIRTAIFKDPVDGPVRVRLTHLDGDGQADLAVHGGRDKAVYLYPEEHYDWWRGELPGMDLPHGAFGENLTTRGLLEGETGIGDRLRVGSAEVVVTQPRTPCHKLALRLGRDDMVHRFGASRRSGFHLRVLQEGEVKAGDSIEVIARDPGGVTVSEILGLLAGEGEEAGTLARAAALEALPEKWRAHFRHRLERHSGRRSP